MWTAGQTSSVFRHVVIDGDDAVALVGSATYTETHLRRARHTGVTYVAAVQTLGAVPPRFVELFSQRLALHHIDVSRLPKRSKRRSKRRAPRRRGSAAETPMPPSVIPGLDQLALLHAVSSCTRGEAVTTDDAGMFVRFRIGTTFTCDRASYYSPLLRIEPGQSLEDAIRVARALPHEQGPGNR